MAKSITELTEASNVVNGDFFDVSKTLGGGLYVSRKIDFANVQSYILTDTLASVVARDNVVSDLVKINFGDNRDSGITFDGTQFQLRSDVVTSTDSLLLRGGTNGAIINVGTTEMIKSEKVITATSAGMYTGFGGITYSS